MQRSVAHAGVELAVEESGTGLPVVLLHGLTATRRYVVMGSRALERGGHRVVAYDARAHGRSSPAPSPDRYGYEDLGADLEAVLDELEIDRAVLAGASMGAHTAVHFALGRASRVAALALITPAHDPADAEEPKRLARWDALATGLRERGIEGFIDAYGDPDVPDKWRDTVLQVLRQRLAEHDHLDALADALEVVPRSNPFADFSDLEAIQVPTVVVASRDEADPGHPYEVGEKYAAAIPRARLLSEPPGSSPLAWQGGQLSRVIEELASTAAREGLLQ